MNDVVDFNKEKLDRETSPECQQETPDGVKLYRYDADYFYPEGTVYGGGTFFLSFWARNDDDAASHVKAIRSTLHTPERVLAEIPD